MNVYFHVKYFYGLYYVQFAWLIDADAEISGRVSGDEVKIDLFDLHHNFRFKQ